MAYYQKGIETIKIIKEKSSVEEYNGFCKGNVIKYITRAGKKPGVPAEEDYKKALYYIQALIESERDPPSQQPVVTPDTAIQETIHINTVPTPNVYIVDQGHKGVVGRRF